MLDKTSYIRRKILERNIEECKHITPEQLEIISILSMEHDLYNRLKNEDNYESEKDKVSLLTIELQNESSVPKVFYKGEQIDNLRELQLDWDTDTNVTYGGLTYAIEYAEKGNKYPVNHRIQREVKGHAL